MHMMAATDGYKVDQAAITKTTSTAEGWLMKLPVPGFKPLSCYKRSAGSAPTSTAASQGEATFQWLFSDGLATVSLFVEDFDKTRHTQEGMIASGATHTFLSRYERILVNGCRRSAASNVKNFAQSLERKR